MLLFSHVVLTAGANKIYHLINSKTTATQAIGFSNGFPPDRQYADHSDYRLIIFGSMLPDILDKPLWLFSQAALFPSGRSYGHTLLFSLGLFFVGLIIGNLKGRFFKTISIASVSHLVLDLMWRNPVTLFWPLLGSIRQENPAGWLSRIVRSVFSFSGVSTIGVLIELAAALIVLYVIFRLIRKQRITEFIKNGFVD